ncbi:MAG: hypothetical protein ACYDAK_12855 [Candidatus Limnocylindrales bacterium]
MGSLTEPSTTPATLAAPSGASLVGWIYAAVGAVAATIQNWIGWWPFNVYGFMTVAQIAAVQADNYSDPTMSGQVTASIQDAMDAVYTNKGGSIFIPRGVYRINANLVQKIDAVTSAWFRILGDGMTTTNIYGGDAGAGLVGYGIQIFGAAPPSYASAFVNVVLEGFSVTCNSLLNSGLDLSSVQRFALRNVQVGGYNYGLRIRNVCLNGVVEDSCYFEANNVGIKASDSNVIRVGACSLKQNHKAGFSITGCNNFSFDSIDLESNPVGGYIFDGCSVIEAENLYYEPSPPYTQPDRTGTNVPFVVILGKDEDGSSYTGITPNTQVRISQALRSGCGYYIDNVDGVFMPDDTNGNNILGPNVKNIYGNAQSGIDSTSNIFVIAKAKNTARNVMQRFPYNWIANGDFSLPSMPIHTLTSLPGGTSFFIKQAETVGGVSENVCDIICANGDTTVSMAFPAKLGFEYQSSYTGGLNVMAAMQIGINSVADVASVALQLIDSGGNIINTTTVTGANFGTSFRSLSVVGNINLLIANTLSLTARLIITRTTGVGSINCVLKEVVCSPTNQQPVHMNSPMDQDAGFSGTVVCATLLAAWYYADVVTGIGNETYFTCQLTAEYDALQTATEVQAQRLTGGSAGTVRIWASKANAVVHYRIVPGLMVTP